MYIPDELVKLLLPDFLVEHFDIIKAEDIEGVLHIDFEGSSAKVVTKQKVWLI